MKNKNKPWDQNKKNDGDMTLRAGSILGKNYRVLEINGEKFDINENVGALRIMLKKEGRSLKWFHENKVRCDIPALTYSNFIRKLNIDEEMTLKLFGIIVKSLGEDCVIGFGPEKDDERVEGGKHGTK